MKINHLISSLAVFFMSGAVALALAQYPGWKNSGSIFLNTTPDGANLPASASVAEFPVLVRLHKDFFNFAGAKPSGEDVRFSAAGKPLAYQIEQWDAASGHASIWVRVPKITGNARQELKLHWGRADAASESSGRAVFNESNGYLAVLHMGEGVADEVGSVQTKDVGTTATAGIIGPARHLGGKQGVFCGEKIENFPVGSSPHKTEAWLRAEQSNGRALAWGNEHGQGKVVMHFMSPPRVKMECYFSGADVASEGRLPMNEWIHIFHTYEKGDSRIYVNGELSNTSKTPNAPLAIKTPARLYIGGWYNNYDFIGDLDEVRTSKVTRPAEWVKLQFENLKPLQTLVGPVVHPGSTFAVSPATATIAEGKSATFPAQAGGAQKVYWVVKSGGTETLAAVDRFTFAFDAGRVTGDKAVTPQCRAIYPEGVKTKDIIIALKETIPDPIFTLAAPKTWDRRGTIEISPKNVKATGDVKTEWSVGPFAVIKEIKDSNLILKRAQNPNDNTGNGWVLPVGKAQKGEKAELGWWGMELAKRLVESQKVPVFFINAAVGGTRIDQHQRDAANPTNLTTIYGRMLWRVQQAKLTHGIRAILWHQGENDQGAAGPTGGYGWETYHPFFVEMAAGWKTDFPNVQNYYVYQIWPNSCAMGGRHGSGDMLREKQRTLQTLFSKMSILSTLGVRPPGGCHFPLEGWAEFARMVQPIIERDHYGKKSNAPLTAPNLRTAKLAAPDSIVLEFDQAIEWDDKLAGQFYLDGEMGRVGSGSVAGAVLTLKLTAPTTATSITYLKEIEWSQEKLLLGANGLAALTFANVPLAR